MSKKFKDSGCSEETKKSGYNKLGVLTHLIIVVICVHAYAQYSMFSGDFGCWFWALISLLFPLLNLIWVFLGLVCYWEINWFLSLIIVILSLLSILPKKKGTIFTVISIGVFIICAWQTSPKVVNEDIFFQKVQQELDQDIKSFMIKADAGLMSKSEGLKYFDDRIDKIKKYRVQALRMGYYDFAEKIGNNVKVERELYKRFK